MSRNYYLRFFTPSPDLTSRIVQLSGELSEAEAADLSEADLAELDTEPEEDFEAERFSESGLPREFAEDERERSTGNSQQFIAESLYSYLASLSRTEEARAHLTFDIYEAIPHGMEENLGLAEADGRCRHLLERLAEEFHSQLRERHHGLYKAGWGEVRLVKGPHMLLVERQAERREERPRYRRAVLSPRASRAYGTHE